MCSNVIFHLSRSVCLPFRKLCLFQFSNLRTAKYEPELFECLQLLLKAKHVDIYKKACNVLYSVITVRLVPHVAPTYWLGRRRAGEGLDSYVPILVCIHFL